MSRLLPTPLELRMFPLRAIIAFAVRCCRRIQPLYDLPHDQPHPTSLEGPLCAAEAFARGDGPIQRDEATRLAVALHHAANAAHYAAHAWSCLEPFQHQHRNDPSINAAAVYAECEARDNRRRAADEALAAVRTVTEAGPGGDVAALAAQIARTATHVTATHVALKARPAVADDFLRLRHLYPPGNTDSLSDVVDPSEIGPLGALWPVGEPEWHCVRE